MGGSKAGIVRERIWSRLRDVALPDSRFHLDFAEVIPDFQGSEATTDRLIELPFYESGS
jgi:5-formyltetrahydrofolate cyclo-ligase